MNLDQTNSVLVLAPHADDEVLGVGASIPWHVAHGEAVDVLVLTNAHLGAPELIPEAIIPQVRAEAKKAHALLGVRDTYFENLLAPRLDTEPCYQIANTIKEYIDRIRPTTLYIPFRGDLHVDHSAIFTAALVAARPMAGQPVRRVLAYETLSETEWGAPLAGDIFVPTLFRDVSEHLQAKVDAMSCFESQLNPFPHPRSAEAIKALAATRGSSVGCHAAEAFQVIRDLE